MILNKALMNNAVFRKTIRIKQNSDARVLV